MWPDASSKRQKEPKAEWAADLVDLRHWRPVFPSECVNADIYQELLRQHVVSQAKGCSLMENTSFWGFSSGLCRPNHLAAVGRILVFSGLAAICARLEFAGLRHQARFAGKSPSYASLESYRPTSTHCLGIGPESGGPDPQNIGFRQRTC